MNKNLSFNREPTVWIQAASALLTILVTFQLDFLTADQATGVVAILTALLGAFNALKTRPVAPAAFVALVTSGTALLTGYGLDLRPEFVGSLTAAVPVVLTLLTRAQVTPADDPKPVEVVVG